ncbi:glycoside hydrolase family 27 protein [Solitalea lacus]|uniref:glycoside hydrolase family 27 protein n=1 Tax=Solitalea lacus TaxID=2911172 RepID=UPI001EDBC167|nr:glycoside hydrolase family 27 protein [Solitalea lacus]UKJ08277.1 hypothetical protein L2B55_03680 [Solitalea lacus]
MLRRLLFVSIICTISHNLMASSDTTNYYILTPKATELPKINGPRLYGARPGKEFIYPVPVSGRRPMQIMAKGLPKGVRIDKISGVITGTVLKLGNYKIVLSAKNSLGEVTKEFTLVIGDQLALTPPMGWSSWYSFGRTVTQEKISKTAQLIKDRGLQHYGWNIIEIDDPWTNQPDQIDSVWNKLSVKEGNVYDYYERSGTLPEISGHPRDKDGTLMPNKNFTAIKPLVRDLHRLGFKVGIYSSPGPLTCCGVAGSYGYEHLDARSWAEIGFDYLKYDWCSYGVLAKNYSRSEMMKPYSFMAEILRKQKRDIVFSICQYGMSDVWEWGGEAGGQLWRTDHDIRDNWNSVYNAFLKLSDKAEWVKPGNWNDPDILQIGYVAANENGIGHQSKLTPTEQYTHMSMWCLLSAPLLIGANVEKLDDFTLNLLTNTEVLEINQDALGKAASIVATLENGIQIWSKPLEEGRIAVGLLNPFNTSLNALFEFEKIGLRGKVALRDVWRQKDLGTFENVFETQIPAHGIVLLTIKN